MINTLTYKILEFNPEHKVLRVEFEGGPLWAAIPLRGDTLPQTEAELADLIRTYAPRVESVIASKVEVDLSFINSLVGKTNTVDRLQLSPAPVFVNAAEEQAAADAAVNGIITGNTPDQNELDVGEEEEARLREFILTILRENHLVA